MTWYLLLIPPLLLLHYTIVVRRGGYVTPDTIFVVSQTALAIAILSRLDAGNVADVRHADVLLLASATYLLFSLVAFLAVRPFSAFASLLIISRRPTTAEVVVLLIAVAISGLYFLAVGYNLVLLEIGGELQGATSVDVATYRLEAYAGERYLFPGYVNQVKNVILPALLVTTGLWLFRTRSDWRWPFAMVAGVLAILGLVGTGQRAPLTLFGAVALVAALLAGVTRKRFGAVLALGAAAMIAFSFATATLRRSSDTDMGLLEAAGRGPGDLWTRILDVNRDSAVVAFRYVYELETQYGAEWLRALKGLLPGQGGSDLSSQVFAEVYGSDRGTIPPSLWGSVYHNAGLAGVFLIAALMPFLLHWVTKKSRQSLSVDPLTWLGIAGVYVTLGTWVAGGPETPINYGLGAYFVLWWWGSRLSTREREDSTPGTIERAHDPVRASQ